MALTEFQRGICRLIADNRMERDDAYVAGGIALNTILNSPRLSRDVDLFHDTVEALAATWDADRAFLERGGYSVRVMRERPSYVEAVVSGDADSVLLQWTCDSAFRFFPLVRHDELGLTLHPFDLATNKALALAGRLETRDWVDLLECHRQIQPLGYLVWAACGKDSGFSPSGILREAWRSGNHSQGELDQLAFAGPVPEVRSLSAEWRAALDDAKHTIDLLPAEQAGHCVLGDDLNLFVGNAAALESALAAGRIRFHAGCIRGAFPRMVGLQ